MTFHLYTALGALHKSFSCQLFQVNNTNWSTNSHSSFPCFISESSWTRWIAVACTSRRYFDFGFFYHFPLAYFSRKRRARNELFSAIRLWCKLAASLHLWTSIYTERHDPASGLNRLATFLRIYGDNMQRRYTSLVRAHFPLPGNVTIDWATGSIGIAEMSNYELSS